MKVSPVYPIVLALLLSCCFTQAQNLNKKTLDHEQLTSWNRILSPQISNDGNVVAYTLKAEEGDATLKIYNTQNNTTTSFDRSEGAKISEDGKVVAFLTKPHQDTLKNQRRRKVKKDDLPKDTLSIYNLTTKELTQIPNVSSFKMPEKWSGWLAYLEKPMEQDSTATDSLAMKPPKSKKKKRKKKKKNKEERLIIKNLATNWEQTVENVTKYIWAEEGQKLALISGGKDSTFLEGIYLFDAKEQDLKPLHRMEGKYKNLAFDEKGTQLTFVADLDTTEARIRPFTLHHWKENNSDSATIIASMESDFLPENWIIGDHFKPRFSEDGSKLFFGMMSAPILEDTLLLDEEKVNVEVWSYTDTRLHTQQKVQLDRDKKRAYQVVYHTADGRFVKLGSEELPETRRGDEGNAGVALAYTELPYYEKMSWEGFPSYKDVYVINTKTGEKKEVAKGMRGTPRLSPAAKYVTWFSAPDTAWFAYSVKEHKIRQITDNKTVPFYDEINDRPMYPSSYSIAGWTKDDGHVLIYDRYDIWKMDVNGNEKPIRLTNGRANEVTYRYIRLDREERFIDDKKDLLLHVFDNKTKASGYATLSPKGGKIKELIKEDYAFTRRPIKAKNADKLIFTKENFQVFPNWHITNMKLENPQQFTDANPQQSEYSWGTIELYEWTALDGQKLQGLLVKPENFDPNKKYPMIVNFYERSSNGLHRHRAPFPHRSTINYSFYASKGYLIFNPDVPYRIGYPGESAYNAVIPGITALINEGFVDKDNIAAQGHSWGGYQVAYLATKTDIFKCIESGAPVVNMVSAYGGIRWGSGLSRMFQYEHTQSRIGGTLWEYPLRYIENSPIFFVDKINTPILILHNDKDGAVPWYQGIEFFVAMRRLGKPAWMLNYNDEPHWPMKLQNRKDFNVRMQQFFDYYLKGTAKPKWMERGVPAMEKGILQGLELKE